jgi:hypothetical protein
MREPNATQENLRARTLRTRKLTAGAPVFVGSVTLLPIERVVMHADMATTGAWFSVAKQPYALVVRDANGIRTLDIDAAAVSLEHLREQIPGLDALLAPM